MVVKREELLALIEHGEDSTVEFKLDEIRASDLAREIVALSNLEGGVILLGVADDGQIVGVQRSNVEEWVVNVCRQHCDPPIIPVINKIKVGDKLVLAVQVSRSREVVSTQRGQYFIRVGSTVQTPTKFELARLFQRAQFVRYDETPVYTTTVDEIALDRVNRYLARLEQEPLEAGALALTDALANLRIAVRIEERIYPTVAGMLTFGKEPRRHLDQTGVMLVRYAGREPGDEVLDSLDAAGTLDEQIEATVAFVRRNMQVRSRLTGEGVAREDLPDYPLLAVREAITNAVAHRDYAILGARARVRMFDDRLEVLSPGGLPNTLTLENIKTVQYARNSLIVSFLQGLGYMERRGEGILRMIRWSWENDAPPPTFELPDENLFQVTLFKRRDNGNEDS